MIDPRLLEWLRQMRGVEREYFDFRGRHCRVPDASLEAILRAFGHALDDETATAEQANRLAERRWRRILPAAIVIRPSRDSRIAISVLRPFLETLVWRVELEDGGGREGRVSPGDLQVLEEQALGELHFSRLALSLPADLPFGYHTLRLETGDGQPLDLCRVIVVPERCYEPEPLRTGGRLWGLAVQLYSVRSRRNWGIGDFTDLACLVRQAAALGADVVGLNPLHALFPADPDLCSPYSPSSRQFLNPMYLDPAAVPEFRQCRAAQDLVDNAEFQARLGRLRAPDRVDYAGVAGAKDEVLRRLFDFFLSSATPDRRLAFEQFREVGGEALRDLAVFSALQTHFTTAGRPGGWQAWPAAYHDPESEAVGAFAQSHRNEVLYHMYLQWLAHDQLAVAEAVARDCGMRVGIYRDLAVGVNGGGADAWADQELNTAGATIGAPPDPLALQGQDWGIPPMRPDVLRERGYRPFIDLLRANMGYGGALRIDHVMGLYRLWWVPAGCGSSEGAYVYYDLEAMMGILALESQRHRCLVIGEDLGTVPDAIRQAMPDYGVYSYRVFYFEHEADGAPRRPENYPERALVAVSTHDLPPLASFWKASDIELRERLALYPDDMSREETLSGRVRQRRSILETLRRAGLYPTGGEADCARAGQPIAPALAEAIQLYLAGSRARLMVVQPEDWLFMEDPVNVPGTSDEHANWRRKLVADLDQWLDTDSARSLGARLTRARSGDW